MASRELVENQSTPTSEDWCDVPLCPAAAVTKDGLCQVHRTAKRAGVVLVGTHCTACKRVMKTGDWITCDSTASTMTHALCPPKVPRLKRGEHAPTPLLDEQAVLHGAD